MRPTMSALLLCALAGFALPAVHEVTQNGLLFEPDTLTITAGDTVRWIWTSGSHTVTNGNGTADPQVGVLFDAFLDAGHTQFEYTFETPGEVLYFCRPHELLDMNGSISVEPKVDVDRSSMGRVKALYGRVQLR